MLYKGNSKIRENTGFGIYKGSTPIKSVYKGSERVYAVYNEGYICFRSSVAGTHTFTPLADVYVSVVIVAGGGGGSKHTFSGTSTATGGSGGMVTGTKHLKKGTSYELIVGGSGAFATSGNVNVGATGGTGGTSSAFGNYAYGGTGGHSHRGWGAISNYNGTGGTATAVSGFTASNGSDGSTTSRYKTYGGGGDGANEASGQSGYIELTVITQEN